MDTQDEIERYIAAQPPAKRDDLLSLHRRILEIAPGCRLWFLSGRNEAGKIVSNPSAGYGFQTLRYANGETRDFYRVGLSANTGGISVYFMELEDKQHLSDTYGASLGKATVTGYCIKFRSLQDVNRAVLDEAITTHMSALAP
ncbi:MAG TPA: DUF1801 domain-containing protein [Phenylobacterium sp.]